MRLSKRSIGALGLASVMALSSMGCDDNGSTGQKFFFNLVGSGQYSSISASVDLAAANALIGEGTCNLLAALETAGCSVTTTEVANRLQITISGCTISALTTLATCQLLSGELGDVQAETEGNGVCAPATPSCDESPTICVSTRANDFSCAGGPVSTTTTLSTTTTSTSSTSTSSTTTSSTTTSSTTTSSTTTTTVPGNQIPCVITFGVTSNETIASLQYDTDYSGASGNFDGTGGSVSCTSSVAGAIAAFNDNDGTKVLGTGLVALAGFTGPLDVATCNYTTSNPALAAGDFGITVTDASDTNFLPLSPTVAVTNVSCSLPETTTTTAGPSTTTTIPSTTTTIASTTTTIGGTTTTTTGGGALLYDIVFQLDDAVTLGALGFDVDYSGAPGDFVGSGGDPGAGGTLQCTSNVAGALASFNDDDAGKVSAAFIALAGFTGPTNVATCVFQSTGPVPVAGDFAVAVTDASDTSLLPVTPTPTVSVASITAQ